MPDVFYMQTFKTTCSALKKALQEPFRKKDFMFCEKETSLTKTIITNISFFIESSLRL